MSEYERELNERCRQGRIHEQMITEKYNLIKTNLRELKKNIKKTLKIFKVEKYHLKLMYPPNHAELMSLNETIRDLTGHIKSLRKRSCNNVEIMRRILIRVQIEQVLLHNHLQLHNEVKRRTG